MTGVGRDGGSRERVPSPGPIRPYHFPEVARIGLDGGLELRLVRTPSLPVATAMLVMRFGESALSPDQAGLAVLAADSLEGGTELRSAGELAHALDGIGASWGAATGWDSTTVALSCLPDHLGEAMPLLAEMARRPSFDEEEFARHRARQQAAASQRLMDPASMAVDRFAHTLYGTDGLYGRPLTGTPEAIGALTADAAARLVRTFYGPADAALVLVGDLERSEAVALAESAWGGWEREAVPVPDVAPPLRAGERSVHVVHRPGSVQSEIRVGHVGVRRAVEDYLPLIVFNLVLGGSFSSRLNLNLRERRGLTYGVRSSFAARRAAGPFSVSTAVETASTESAVVEIVREIEAMATDGPTRGEVDAATSYLAGVFPLRLQSTGQIASRVAGSFIHDLPEGYNRSYRERVREVTRAEAARAARHHLHPDGLCTVVVGDAEAVRSQLEGLGMGEVAVHEAPTAASGP